MKSVQRSFLFASLLAASVFFTGCAVGPDYARPDFDIPAAYREPAEGWKLATPSDGQIQGDWWALYQDGALTQLVEAVDVDNQSLKAQEARYRQAIAQLRQARAGLFPTVDAGAGTSRTRANATTRSNYEVSVNAGWELDLWGRVRRNVESQQAALDMSKADLAALRLSLQTTVVQTYVQLRVTDARLKLMRETVANYEKSLEITQNRYNAGVVTRADVSQATTQLESARTQLIDLEITRTQTQNSLAQLVGKLPAQFGLEEQPSLTLNLPEIPIGLPSSLLERRPDIAAAERSVAAANAQIGVSQAAYYPSLTLSAQGGYSASDFSDLFDLPARVWSLGASLAQFIFDGGRREAVVEGAKAAYDETVANYKQTVITAFGEVENNLTSLRVLDLAMKSQDIALEAARRTETLTTNQYKAGAAPYVNVVTAQNARLTAEDNAIQLKGRQLTASVALIGAIGGGYGDAGGDEQATN
jgi:NodT family efflux transporter outer membrane factor (OMF) lipoprotein